MKKISNVEVKLINLNATDVIATSGPLNASFGAYVNSENDILVGGRGYYDDEEDF